MIAVTGSTGRVGSGIARLLRAEGVPVRAVLRNESKGEALRHQGCEISVAAPDDVQALEKAFAGAEACFVLPPPVFDPQPDFAEYLDTLRAHLIAIGRAGVKRVVYLSTVGAQARETNLLSQHTLGEHLFRELQVPVTYLRPAWFLENAEYSLGSIRKQGTIYSLLGPLDRAIAMVSVADVSVTAARLLQERWEGHRVVELEGPGKVSPRDLADAFEKALGKEISLHTVPRERWDAMFREQGMQNPQPRMRMLDGFNEGWIDFEFPGKTLRGTVAVDAVVARLLASPEDL